MKEALKKANFPLHLSIAEDGVLALEHMRSAAEGSTTRPDMIVLDLNLPRKNGLEVLRELKASPVHHHIPVLMMSSSREEADIRECYRLNANCYITKPSSLDAYLEVVQSIEDFWFMVAKLPTRCAA